MTVTEPVPPFTTTRTVQRRDVDLVVVKGGNPAGPTVVMVHGWPDTHRMWTAVAGLLAPDFRVVAYDTRGQGLSRAAHGASYSLADLADDLRAVVDAVDPGGPVHLLGHDWGSIQAWEAVCDPGAEERFASFTSMSGPNLDHLAVWTREHVRRPTPRGIAAVAAQAVSSSYVPFLVSPMGPAVLRTAGSREGWRLALRATEGRPLAPGTHAPSLARDMANGVRYYRANILGASRHPRRRTTRVPVLQLALTRDLAVRRGALVASDRWVDRLERTDLPHGHWVALTHPEVVVEEVARFVGSVEGLSARG